jgi:crotonobetainyl-CoA:carnitine CoA-transferase CaiB-like acyl-CoA transferase
MLGIQNEREWAKLCEIVLGDAALATDERFKNNSLRAQNRADLKAIIVDRFSTMSADEVLVKLDEATVANAKVNDMKGLWDHPQLKARGRWTEVDTPAGRVPALLPAGVATATDTRLGPIPKVGEHNAKILKELGM